MSNWVSYKQNQYNKALLSQNITLRPLDDALFPGWFPVYTIPTFVQERLIDAVDALTVTYAIGAIIIWFLRGQKIQTMAEILTIEIILLPMFAISQWFTVIPDSYPNCLELNNIPSGDDPSWIYTRFGRACGDMIWSSAIAQVIIFFKLYDDIPNFCTSCKTFCRVITRAISITYIAVVVSLAITARYQYSMDIVVTMFVTLIVSSHQFIPKLARHLYVRRYRELASANETERLVSEINTARI